MSKNSKDDIISGHINCPRCQIPLLEKIPLDKRQLQSVVRFFCPCGYYTDIPLQELHDRGMDLLH